VLSVTAHHCGQKQQFHALKGQGQPPAVFR
jgi:hypothetical protein